MTGFQLIDLTLEEARLLGFPPAFFQLVIKLRSTMLRPLAHWLWEKSRKTMPKEYYWQLAHDDWMMYTLYDFDQCGWLDMHIDIP